MSSELSLMEPFPIDDEFCCGLACIEDLGQQARFVLYSNQVRYEDGCRPIRVVQKKIILPFDAIRPGVEMTLGFLARRAVSVAGASLIRLVRP